MVRVITIRTAVNSHSSRVHSVLGGFLLVSVTALLGKPVMANALDDAEKIIFEWNDSPPEATRSLFFKSVSSLLTLSQKMVTSKELVEFQQDKLRYYQAKIEAGEIEQKDLWPLAGSLTKARRTASTDSQAYNVALEIISREWGGEQWWLVMDLLAEYTNASRSERP